MLKAVIRRARAVRDEPFLMLKLKWAIAHPISLSARLRRFITPQTLQSKR
jgi:hypothetical protein